MYPVGLLFGLGFDTCVLFLFVCEACSLD